MIRVLCLCGLLALPVCRASADEYWIAYEGNDFPENEGWRRITFGGGAERFLDQGNFVIDSLASTQIADFYEMRRNGELDPDPGELFLMQWRLRIEEVIGFMDISLGVNSDERWAIAFQMNTDTIRSALEGLTASFDPGVFHEFALTSTNMRTYELRIDGKPAIKGQFRLFFDSSRVGWGDGIQGSASLSRWDYFKFGVVPEPNSALLFSLAFMIRRDQR